MDNELPCLPRMGMHTLNLKIITPARTVVLEIERQVGTFSFIKAHSKTGMAQEEGVYPQSLIPPLITKNAHSPARPLWTRGNINIMQCPGLQWQQGLSNVLLMILLCRCTEGISSKSACSSRAPSLCEFWSRWKYNQFPLWTLYCFRIFRLFCDTNGFEHFHSYSFNFLF